MPDHPRRHSTLPDLAFAAARFGAMPAGGFAAGTLLDAPGGPVPVERLRPGDRLTTIDGGSIRLRHAAPLSGSDVPAASVLLPPDALGPGRPRRAVWLDAGQAVWLAGPRRQGQSHHALAALGLLCGAAVRRADAGSPPLHLLLAAAGPAGAGRVVLAEGLACALRPPIRPEHDPHAGAALAAARQAQPRAQTAPANVDGAAALDARQQLSGWALDRAAPKVPVLLEILLDDLSIGFALADEKRPDLAMAGLGACGFTLSLAPWKLPRSGALLRVHVVGAGASLPGSPLLLAG
jgi:hypothetical protein